jgi:hypothetical protein
MSTHPLRLEGLIREATTSGVRLTLDVRDAEVVAELLRRPEGERERYALQALRVGVLAIEAASGRIDAQAIGDAGTALVGAVREALVGHSSQMLVGLSAELGRYFDPKSGAVPDRLRRFVAPGGELEALLARHFAGEDSVLARRLSDLVRKEFSLDGPDSVLARFSRTMDGNVDAIVREFDLNREDSALSRMRREMAAEVDRLLEQQTTFQEKVSATLEGLRVRREERERSIQKGIAFEAALGAWLAADAQSHGDVAEAVGQTTGSVRACRVGDHVVTLGPDSPAAGARIAIEAKEDRKVDLKAALAEMEVARKNRCAEIGIFVYAAKAAPDGLRPLARYGADLVVVWDAEDPATDLRLDAAMSIVRALASRARAQAQAAGDTVQRIEQAVVAIEREIQRTEDVRRFADTIRSSAEKIVGETRVGIARLKEAVDRLSM